MSAVSRSTWYEPASGSTASVTPLSNPITCCVRSASVAAASVGSASASSNPLVWSDWVPPNTAASAWSVTRGTLTSGCWACSVDPAVWVWNRSIWALG